MKMKAASEIGISAQHIQLPSSISQSSLIQKVDALNQDPSMILLMSLKFFFLNVGSKKQVTVCIAIGLHFVLRSVSKNYQNKYYVF